MSIHREDGTQEEQDSGDEPQLNVRKSHIPSSEEILERGRHAVDGMLGELDTAFGDLRGTLSDLKGQVMGGARTAGRILKHSLQTSEEKAALESSALVWDLVTEAGDTGGYILNPEGQAISPRFDNLEGLEVDVGGERMAIALGTLGGKEFILFLDDSDQPVRMGSAGFDNIESYGRLIVGVNGDNKYIVDPKTGGVSAKLSL